jgi:hypothetical protein
MSIARCAPVLLVVLTAGALGGCDGRTYGPGKHDLGEPSGASPVLGSSGESLPAALDKRSRLPRPRNQGDRYTCVAFAFTSAVEGFYGFSGADDCLSVETTAGRLALSSLPASSIGEQFLPERIAGLRLARESFWPYGAQRKEEYDAYARYGIDRLVSTGTDPSVLRSRLVDKSENFVVAICEWDPRSMQGGMMVNPRLPQEEALARAAACDLRALLDNSCAGHGLLLAGYRQLKDSDGEIRPFFIARNSWGTSWGDYGYGYMSPEYLRAMCRATYLIEAAPAASAGTSP